MSDPSSELALVERLRSRDPEALAAAYDRYSALVYSLFLRITRDQSVAEDLVQELFIRVWNHVGSFDQSKGALGSGFCRSRGTWELTTCDRRMPDFLLGSNRWIMRPRWKGKAG